MKTVKALKPRLGQLNTLRLTTVNQAAATPRLRGRSWMARRSLWLSAHPLCCMCQAEGRTTAGAEVDHITPLWQGGADDESNYQTLCEAHHKAKTAREAGMRTGKAVQA